MKDVCRKQKNTYGLLVRNGQGVQLLVRLLRLLQDRIHISFTWYCKTFVLFLKKYMHRFRRYPLRPLVVRTKEQKKRNWRRKLLEKPKRMQMNNQIDQTIQNNEMHTHYHSTVSLASIAYSCIG